MSRKLWHILSSLCFFYYYFMSVRIRKKNWSLQLQQQSRNIWNIDFLKSTTRCQTWPQRKQAARRTMVNQIKQRLLREFVCVSERRSARERSSDTLMLVYRWLEGPELQQYDCRNCFRFCVWSWEEQETKDEESWLIVSSNGAELVLAHKTGTVWTRILW